MYYPIRKGELLNLVIVVSEGPSGSEQECYKEEGSVENLQAHFRGWSSEARGLVRLVTECRRWPLRSREPLPTWLGLGGRLCLMGDAAHPMLPFVAQVPRAHVFPQALCSVCQAEQQGTKHTPTPP